MQENVQINPDLDSLGKVASEKLEELKSVRESLPGIKNIIEERRLASQDPIEDYSYCQSQIEERDKCDKQCDHCKEYYAPLEKEKSDDEVSDSTFVDMRALGLNGALKIFEYNIESGEIRQARIVSKRLVGKKYLSRFVEVKKGCRYVAAKNFSDADRKFTELVTGKKYSEIKREIKKGNI